MRNESGNPPRISAYYSATMQYVNAVKAVGSDRLRQVMAQLKTTKINDFFAKTAPFAPLRGLMVHTMYSCR